MSRKINEAGLALIKEYEGCRLNAYQDTAGIWTIGYGHTRGVYPVMRITQEEADQALADDLAGAEHVVDDATAGVNTSDNQFAAMVSLCFNVGSANFRRSKILYFHRKSDPNAAAETFLLWNRIHIDGGQLAVAKGLTKRRKAERELYLTA